jgi:hypothetical protein
MTELFIEKSKLIHGDKYDYSKVDYLNSRNKVIIICKIHGGFLQKPNGHLDGKGCKKCGRDVCSNKLKFSSEEFIQKAKIIHGDKYDYSKVNYINCNTKVIIICKIHGEFLQIPSGHLSNKGCSKCSNIYNYSTLEFIDKVNIVHGDKYDYSKVNYTSNKKQITIICKIHGEFQQISSDHLNGHGCKKCYNIKQSITKLQTKEDFIQKSKLVHGDLYDYSKVEYKYSNIKVIIICKIHGEFEQIPTDHYNLGCGCQKCSYNKASERFMQTKEDFIEKSRLVHGDIYDYSKVDYKGSTYKVIIICKIHGEFTKTPIAHYNSCSGCPKCSNNGYSKKQILWLNFLSKYYDINIQHAENTNEFTIPETKYKADGYCKENNTIYEFHGDYWHGNPKVFNPDDINEITKMTYKELYDKTLIRENKIKGLGYNLVTIWENDWKKINNSIKILQQKFRQYHY